MDGMKLKWNVPLSFYHYFHLKVVSLLEKKKVETGDEDTKVFRIHSFNQ